MLKILDRSQFLLLILSALVLVLYFLDSIWSSSIDFAEHYGLAYRLTEDWFLPKAMDPVIHVMGLYPRLSHFIAALLGSGFDSIFIGLQLTSLLSLVFLWGGIVISLNSLPRRIAFWSNLFLAVLVIINRYYLKVELHGSEIVTNFFFAQLLSQALVFLAIAVAISLEIRGKHPLLIWFFLLAIFTLTLETHSVPAVELFGVIIAKLWFQKLKLSPLKNFACFLGFSFLSFLAIFFHPSFKIMIKISENNGCIQLNNIQGIQDVGILALCALTLALVQLLIWHKSKLKTQYIALKYFSFYGGSIALGTLAQIAVLSFHLGSEYAIKKFVFGLYTYLLVSIAILLALFFSLLLKEKNLKKGNKFLETTTIILSFTSLFYFSLPVKSTYHLATLVQIEKKLKTLSLFAFPKPSNAKTNAIYLDLPTEFNNLFSLVFTHTASYFSHDDYKELLDNNNYLMLSLNSPYFFSKCSTVYNDIAVSKTDCIQQSIRCSGNYDFSLNNQPLLIQGFSELGLSKRWTLTDKASFYSSLPQTPPTKMAISITPFIMGAKKSQRLKIVVNSGKTQQSFDFKLTKKQTFNLPLLSLNPGDQLSISFQTPDLLSPKQVGLNEDPRLLGVAVDSIRFS